MIFDIKLTRLTTPIHYVTRKKFKTQREKIAKPTMDSPSLILNQAILPPSIMNFPFLLIFLTHSFWHKLWPLPHLTFATKA